MKRALVAVILFLCLLLCSCAPGISGDRGTAPPSTEPTLSHPTDPPVTVPPATEPPATVPVTEPFTQPTDPNDPATANVRLLISSYFSERISFLQGTASDIPSAITSILNDEEKHLDAITTHQATLLTSSFTIHSIAQWDKIAEVSVTETVTYLIRNTETQYTIPHAIIIDCTRDDGIIVSSDAYYDEPLDFYSCSYVRLPDNYPNYGN